MDPQNNQTLSNNTTATPSSIPPMSAGTPTASPVSPVTTPVIKFTPSIPKPVDGSILSNPQRPVTPPAVPPMTASTNKPSAESSTSSLVTLLLGLILGGGLATGYFIYFAPKPAPVVVEKQVPVVQNTQIPVFPLAPPRTYDFRTIKVLDSNSATTTLSDEDSVVVESVKELLKKDKDVGSLVNSIAEVIVSPGLAFAKVHTSKDGQASGFGFIVDLEGGKALEKFPVGNTYFMDQGTFIFGNDSSGLSFYSYGTSSSIKIPNSTLTGNQTYVESVGPSGASSYKVTATSTNSISFGIYDKTQPLSQGEEVTHYKKVGERAFLIQ